MLDFKRRFFVFAYDEYYPKGALLDIQYTTDCLVTALEIYDRYIKCYDSVYIYDNEDRKIILDNVDFI